MISKEVFWSIANNIHLGTAPDMPADSAYPLRGGSVSEKINDLLDYEHPDMAIWRPSKEDLHNPDIPLTAEQALFSALCINVWFLHDIAKRVRETQNPEDRAELKKSVNASLRWITNNADLPFGVMWASSALSTFKILEVFENVEEDIENWEDFHDKYGETIMNHDFSPLREIRHARWLKRKAEAEASSSN